MYHFTIVWYCLVVALNNERTMHTESLRSANEIDNEKEGLSEKFHSVTSTLSLSLCVRFFFCFYREQEKE